MFSAFILLVIIRLLNKYLDNGQFTIDNHPNLKKKGIENYYPLVFHCMIIVLIIISVFSKNLLTDASIHALVSDGIFQFVSTLLIVIISIINPFVTFSAETKLKLETLTNGAEYASMKWLLAGKNWQLIKATVCILIVAYFIYDGILVIPQLNQGLISSITVVLILFFVFGNIFQLIKNPTMFKQQTLFRLSMLYRSFKLSFFISLPLIAILFLFGALTNIDVPKLIKIDAIVLMVYNVVMAFNEYKILKA